VPAIELLVKPASGSCNLRCRYCFYVDEMNNREQPALGLMSLGTMETMVQKALQFAHGRCSFVFQGGEPTLSGIDFYSKLHEFVDKYNDRHIPVAFAIQTNGILMDDRWASLFSKHRYLVGLSLDGPKNVHDRHRRDEKGEGTHERVMAAAALLMRYGVDFNVLCVVTAQTARQAENVYRFFKKNGFDYQQYLPCLEPLFESAGRRDYSLTPALYAAFLKRLFDLWHEDLTHGRRVYNRTFENWIGMLRGIQPESCGYAGVCGIQHVVEADGSVYPCDFYALDDYRIGSILTDSFEQMHQNRQNIRFIEQSSPVDPDCRTCRWGALCRGGCRRYREPFTSGLPQKNLYCEAYKDFFDHAGERMLHLARQIRKPVIPV
jgi:uncharacterized protein